MVKYFEHVGGQLCRKVTELVPNLTGDEPSKSRERMSKDILISTLQLRAGGREHYSMRFKRGPN